MIVSKKVSFDAAHYLPDYKGKCHNMHGHHWVCEVGIEGEVKNNGMVIDFVRLKDWMNQDIVEVFDHKIINDKIENPTAENIALWIAQMGHLKFFGEEVNLAFVRVWETENSMVEWRP